MVERAGATRMGRPRRVSIAQHVAAFLAILSFGGYFVLILWCGLNAPETFGADLAATANGLSVGQVKPGSPADRAGLSAGDRILTIDRRPVRTALDWTAVIARIDFDHPLPLTFTRNTNIVSGAVVFRQSQDPPWRTLDGVILLVSRFVQLVTIIFAGTLAVQATDVRSTLGAWLLATISVFCVILPPRLASVWGTLPWPVGALFVVPLTSTVVIGGSLLAFFATFFKTRWTSRRVVLFVLPMAVIVLWEVEFIVAMVYRPDLLASIINFMPVVVLVNLAYFVACMALVLMADRTRQEINERRRARLLLVASVAGCAASVPTVAAMWLGFAGGPTSMYRPPIGLQLAFTAFLVVPISFWWAIVRHQLFDVQFFARRGLHYVFARRAVVVVTPLTVVALVIEGSLHQRDSIADLLHRHGWLYATILLLLLMFHLRRAAWLDQLDRRLFRERYDATQLLRAMAAQVRTTKHLETAAEFAVAQICAALHPSWVAVYGRDANDDSFRPLASEPRTTNAWNGGTSWLNFLRAIGKPLEINLSDQSWLREHLPTSDLEALEQWGARLIVPILLNPTGPEAILVLGTKRSEEPFSREDKELLQAVAESLTDLTLSQIRGALRVQPDGDDDADPSWDQRLFSLAEAVANGGSIDWDAEEAGVVTERQRQFLSRLRALERLVNLHTAPSSPERVRSQDGIDNAGPSASRPEQWGPFHIRGRIGSGSFGSVYRAWDPKLEREVAVKLLDVDRVDRQAVLREARLLARVRHPNVVHVYGADETGGVAGFWMELIEGHTLTQILQEQGPFGCGEAVAIGTTICRALSAIHLAGLVHQDVKAQNVMRERGGRLVLMDFGAGVTADDKDPPRWGTPHYMGPELFEGARASTRSDVFSVGVLLFHLVTGEFPSGGRTYHEVREWHQTADRRWLRDLRPDLPSQFHEAVDRALAPDPARRFGTAGELASAMRLEDQ
jgi:hypothetical protein